MPAGLTILTGPARSGKTERLLDRYRRALRELPPGGAMWIAPTYRAGQRVVERLLDGGLSGCFSPGVATFDQFAQRVLAASGRRIRPLPPASRRALVRWLIAGEHSAGRLPWFGRIAETSGLVDLIVGFLGELKRLEIWPEEFQRTCQTRGASQKDRELFTLYAAYQQALVDHDLYDAEGKFWSARDLLSKGQERPIEALRLLVLDGFADFTRTQLEILEVLASRGIELHVSLPLEPGPREQDLFAKSRATLNQLQALADRGLSVGFESTQRRGDSAWPAMRHVEAELFLPAADVHPQASAAGLEIITASQERGEVEQISRRIKRLLIEGDDLAGGARVKPGEIAVVVRSLQSYATLVRETFAEFGIPTALETGRRLGDAPLAAALLLVLRLHAEDWPYRTLLAVLGHNLFRPNWPGRGSGLASALELVRQLQVPTGCDAMLAAARDAVAAAEAADSRSGPARKFMAQGLALLDRLARTLAALPSATTPAEWAAAIADLNDELGLSSRQEPGDLAAWEKIIEGLHGGEQLFRAIEQPPPKLSPAALVALLEDHLDQERLPREADDAGRVRVMAAPSIRALDVPYLFFAGLSERSFPAAESASHAYSEQELDRLRDAGLPLPTRSQRGYEEMLLFYEVLTRATRRLWLSYPALDHRAEPLLPSPYVREVEALFTEKAIVTAAASDLSPLPPANQPLLAPRELRLQSVIKAMQGQGDLLAAVGRLGPDSTAASAPRPAVWNVLAGLEVIHERAASRQFGRYEGLMHDPAAIAALAERFGQSHIWSATELESYATCPHKFFLQRVLSIQPRPELALETDYLERGSLLHEVLARAHARWDDRAAADGAAAAEELRAILDEVIREVFSSEQRHAPLAEALREIHRRAVVQWLSNYGEQLVASQTGEPAFDEPLRPAHFETAFGRQVEPPADGAPAGIGRKEPVELRWGANSLSLAGRVDRIDVGRLGGQQVFRLIDYKSGRTRDAKKVREALDGRRLQLELYALAVQEMLPGAVPWDAGYWHVQLDGYEPWRQFAAVDEGAPVEDQGWADKKHQLLERVFSLVEGARSGQFPMHNSDDKCTGRCEFRTVCRVNQVRALDKEWTPPSAT